MMTQRRGSLAVPVSGLQAAGKRAYTTESDDRSAAFRYSLADAARNLQTAGSWKLLGIPGLRHQGDGVGGDVDGGLCRAIARTPPVSVSRGISGRCWLAIVTNAMGLRRGNPSLICAPSRVRSPVGIAGRLLSRENRMKACWLTCLWTTGCRPKVRSPMPPRLRSSGAGSWPERHPECL